MRRSTHSVRHKRSSTRPRSRAFLGFSRVWVGLVVVMVLLVGRCQAIKLWQTPQVVLVLGGSPDREKFAAQFAQEHPDLPIWVSSGSPPEYSEWVFDEAEIDRSRLHLDYQAVDTLTNFTTLVDELKAQGVQSVYLVTSDYHMRRASLIAEVVLGSRGISFKPVEIASDRSAEPLVKALLDGGRAIVWLTTGYTSVKPQLPVQEQR